MRISKEMYSNYAFDSVLIIIVLQHLAIKAGDHDDRCPYR